MLNAAIQQKIIATVHGHVLSTSMVSRKTRLSRITVAKYLHALETKGLVQAVHIGKAVAWRVTERKPLVAILAKPGTARIIKLALGERYSYALVANPTAIRDAFVMITDNPTYERSSAAPVVLIGHASEHAYSLPELFDTLTMKMLVKKLYYEQNNAGVRTHASVTIENFDAFEEALGIYRSEELLKLTARMLRENKVICKQSERTTFFIEGDLPSGVLVDIEQTFHLILAHIYGRMVNPGEEIVIHGESHAVPSLSITLGASQETVAGVTHNNI